MFDPTTQVATAAQLADRIASTHATVREAECEELVLAAAWADVHYLDPDGSGDPGDPGDHRPLIERACAWGGDGCPPVSEHCAHELGALRGTGAVSARMLIADALDLRHRLPRLWALVTTGVVRAWQARAVAQATHALTWEQAVAVDTALSSHLSLVAWPRFRRLLDAAVLDADPDARRDREQQARTARGVWSYVGEHGLATLVAKAASGDVRWFCAAVDRIADLLRLEGDAQPVDVRRARAIGLLAQPALALDLLARHAGDTDPCDQEPADPEDPEDLEAPAESVGGRSLLLGRPGLTDAELRRVRPRVVIHLHLTDTALRCGDGLVRPEHGEPLTLSQVRDWLADTGCAVTVRPVVDPLDTQPVDAYETPIRLRDALYLRNPVDVFPYGNATSRTIDLDHSVPYVPLDRDGPAGQTGLHNLGPLARHHHRAVTLAGWRRRQPSPGVYVFRSPNGHVYLTTNHGTLALGRTDFSRAFCQTAGLGSDPFESVAGSAAA